MNLIGLLSLLWAILKSTVANETVNTAMDNWTKGTSNEIDDMVWKLLEDVTGVKDEEVRKAMLADGLKAIEEKYEVAKLEGRVLQMKQPTKRWDPPTYDEIRKMMDPSYVPFNPETDQG